MSESLFKYGKDIEWSLPFLFQNEPIYGVYYNVCKEYGIELPNANLFGSPKCAWDGGRCATIIEPLDSKTILRAFRYVKELNATPSLTFSKTVITKEDLEDEYSNLILDIALEIGAKFIVCSDVLKNYIKEKKSDAHIIASVIKPALRFQGKDKIEEPTVEAETNFYNELLKEYDTVVVRPEYCDALAENPSLIDDISRIEVLINQVCIKDCPKMPDHYRYLESYNLLNPASEPFECYHLKFAVPQRPKLSAALKDETVRKLCQSGVRHLKLQGRGQGTCTSQDLMHLLANKIFNSNGENYEIIRGFENTRLNSEVFKMQKYLDNVNNMGVR